jgi:hypothetical protein
MMFLILSGFFGMGFVVFLKKVYMEIKGILVTEVSQRLFDRMFKTLLYRTGEIAYLYCAAKESH